jgi:hypothetical protein
MNYLLPAKRRTTRLVENQVHCQIVQKHYHDFFCVAAMGCHHRELDPALIQRDVLLVLE